MSKRMKFVWLAAVVCTLSSCTTGRFDDAVSPALAELRLHPTKYHGKKVCVTGIAYNGSWYDDVWNFVVEDPNDETDYLLGEVAPDRWNKNVNPGDAIRACGTVDLDLECFEEPKSLICAPLMIDLKNSHIEKLVP